jgi:hypothetical protein
VYLITTRCYLQIIGQLQLSHKIIGIYSGVWKYGNVLLSRARYLKKVTCLDKILLVLFLFKHSTLVNTVAVHECQGGFFLKVLFLISDRRVCTQFAIEINRTCFMVCFMIA